jgi:hypothetical protein
MSKKVPSILPDFALAAVLQMKPEIQPYDSTLIRSAFENYVEGTIPRSQVAQLLASHIDDISPLVRLDEIMACANDPVPGSPEPVANHSNDGSRSRKKTRGWTTDEDNRLIYGVHKHGLENWTFVAQFVGNGRTRSMCSQRWIRVLDPRISRSHWTPEEEQKLVQLVGIYGEKSWMKVATNLGNRSDVQCRYRYLQFQRGTKMFANTGDAPSGGARRLPKAVPQAASMPVIPATRPPQTPAKMDPVQGQPIAPSKGLKNDTRDLGEAYDIFATETMFDQGFFSF